MALQTEVWARDLAKKLFPDNMFMNAAIDDTVWINNNKVHLPQAGAPPNVEVNRTTIPATVTTRTDDELEYSMKEFSSDPVRIRDLEAIEISYNKRDSVLEQHGQAINEKIARWMAYWWAPTLAASFVRTTGADRVAFTAGATGNRKKITLDDWLGARRLLDNMDVPDDGNRYALVPAEMYNDMLSIDKVLSAEYNQMGRLPKGVINEIFGIKIFKRSAGVSYSNAGTPVLRTPDDSALTTANAGIIIWHSSFTRRAKGSTEIYYDEKNPTIYGSVFSAAGRAGGSKSYKDGTGVVAIIEAAGS